MITLNLFKKAPLVQIITENEAAIAPCVINTRIMPFIYQIQICSHVVYYVRPVRIDCLKKKTNMNKLLRFTFSMRGRNDPPC